MKKFVFLFFSMLAKILKQSTGKLAWLRLQRVVEGEVPFLIVMDRFHMTMLVYQNNEEASILVYQKQKGVGARNNSVCTLVIAHLRYISILTCLRGKLEIFTTPLSRNFLRRYLSTKKTKPNIEK